MGSGSSIPFEDEDGVAIQVPTPSKKGWGSIQNAVMDRSFRNNTGDEGVSGVYDPEPEPLQSNSWGRESPFGRPSMDQSPDNSWSQRSPVSATQKQSKLSRYLGGGGVTPRIDTDRESSSPSRSPVAKTKGWGRTGSMVDAINSIIPILKAKKAEESKMENASQDSIQLPAQPLPAPPEPPAAPVRKVPWPDGLGEFESVEKQAYFELHQVKSVIGSWWAEVSRDQTEDPWDNLYKRIKPRMKKKNADVVAEAEQLFDTASMDSGALVDDSYDSSSAGKSKGGIAGLIPKSMSEELVKGLMGDVDATDQKGVQLQAKALFADMDMDRSKGLTKAELSQALKGHGVNMSQKEVDRVFKEMDANGDNKVSLDEFMFAMNIPTDNVRVELERWLSFSGVMSSIMMRLPSRPSPNSGPFDGVKKLVDVKDAKKCLRGLTDEIAELIVAAARTLRDAEDKTKSALQSNSKYATSNEVFTGSFGNIQHYSEGLDAHVGLPNAKVWETMRKEHCTSNDSMDTFETNNYGGTKAKPVQEWEIVVTPVATRVYAGKRHVMELDIFLKAAQVEGLKVENDQERDMARMLMVRTALSQFAEDAAGKRKKALDAVIQSTTGSGSSFADVCTALQEWIPKDELVEMVDMRLKHLQQANLCREEVVALRLYTGPMYMKYNAVLRGFPKKEIRALKGNRYTTTIHAVVSGLLKLQAVTIVPSDHKVYRGMSGMQLPDQFWNKDEFGCRGGVEFGLLSTTTKREVAMQYAGDGVQPMIFEISVGQVDRGASLSWISQYADEEEILFPPLSNLEVTGDPKMDVVDGVVATVIPIRINANTRCLTLDELKSRRKTLHLDMFVNILDEIERDLIEKQPAAVEIAKLGDLKKRGKESSLGLGMSSPEDALVPSPGATELPVGADKSSRVVDKTVKMLLDECKAIHERHRDRPSEWYNEDEQQKVGLVEAVDLKGLTLTKHKVLLQAQGLGQAQYELAARTPLSDFADRGVVYMLMSSFEKFPWVELFKRVITEIVVPTEMEPWQLEMAWEAMSEVKEVVRSVQIQRAVLKGPFNSALMWSNCTFSSATFEAMRGLFYVHTGITALDLRSSELGPAEADALAPSLRIMTDLKTLHLEHNRLTPKGLSALQASFPFLTSLQMLTVRENGLGAYSGKMVVASLKRCERLQFVDDIPIGILRAGGGRGKLDLTSKSIGPTEAGLLAELFAESGKLTALCLGNNQLGSEGGAAIAIGFLHLDMLQRLELDYNEIGEDGGVSLAEPMKQLTGLVTLSLRKNDLMRRGGSVVCQAFEKMTNLENLDLASNYIEDQSVHNLSKYLSTLTRLRSLDLGNNKIGPNAFAALCTCLAPLSRLEALIVRENSLGPEGAEALAEGIRTLTELKVLDLGFSRVGRKGGLALAAKTRWMTALQKLKFEGNSMGQDAVSQIQTTLPDGCQLDIEAS